ncbi:recombination regulator RecX, partial [Streptomyces sp. SID7804]|nr:recombination regulator RecX [Streptomyces sp. SID7804]
MTRRTDWAEYEFAASGVPRGRDTVGGDGSAVREDTAYDSTGAGGFPDADSGSG